MHNHMFISHMHLCLSLVGYPDFTRLKCFWYKVRCHFYNDLSRKKPPCEFDNYLEGNEHAKMIERSFEYGFFYHFGSFNKLHGTPTIHAKYVNTNERNLYG